MATFARLLAIVLLFLHVGCSSTVVLTQPVTDSPSFQKRDPIAHTLQSVGVLLRKQGDAKWGGNGVCALSYIGPNRLITANHCIMPAAYSKAEFTPDPLGLLPEPSTIGREVRWVTYQDFMAAKGPKGDQTSGKVIKVDDGSDIAVIELAQGEKNAQVWLSVRGEDPVMGEDVMAFGHPLGLHYSFSRGYVAFPLRVLDDGKTRYLQADLGVYFGNSGGPLVDKEGYLVGVCSAFAEVPHLAFFSHPSAIRDLMKSVGWN